MERGLGDPEALRALFVKAVQLPPEDRLEFLSDPGISPETRDEVLALLDADRGSETFLRQSVASEQAPEIGAGDRFGPYETRSILGHGGMGVVFKADRVDGELHQTVAIKVVQHAWLDPRALDRFRNERQLLASLTHSNIARLLDGGTRADGVAYLVMEYVDGVPLDQYCDRHGLNITERLRLFLPLCEAVEYAHTRLVIHRDLKPSNVLVTAQGEPKLLDFGIARALDAPVGEQTGTFAMTPQFASPEQARGEQATTATDVYGLGAILYFILTGQPIHAVAGPSREEIRRTICDTPPQLPSQLRPELKGDLENILLKALHPEPQRRYRSVREFSEDFSRFLDRRPVLATRDGWAYRTRRFLQRHTVASAAAALTLLAIVSGTAESLYQAHRAQRRFEQVRALANKFVFDFEGAIRNTPGTLEARRMVAATGRKYLADLAADAGHDPSLSRELAGSYYRLALVEIAAGESQQGLQDMKHSIALLRDLKDGCCGSPAQRSQYILELTQLAGDQSDGRFVQDAERSIDEALQAARAWVAHPGHDPRAEISLATVLSLKGTVLLTEGKTAEARSALEETLRQGPAIRAGKADNDAAEFALAIAGYSLARVLDSLNDLPAALSALGDSQHILDDLVAKHPDNVQWSDRRVYLLASKGDLLYRLSDKDKDKARLLEAYASFQQANAIAHANLAKNPGNKDALEGVAYAAMKEANHLEHVDRTKEAIPILQESIAAAEELVRKDPASRRNRYIQVSNQQLMGAYLENMSQYPESLQALAKAEHMLTEALQNSPGDIQLLRAQVNILIDQSKAERRLGHLAAARAHCQQALDVTATLIDRQKTSKRPIGSAMIDLREEARLLGVRDFTLTVPGLQ
jgi:tetratricopeptide (TPR) repeat protein